MLNLARLNALDSIQHGFCNRAQTFGSGGDGDILSFVTDATKFGGSTQILRRRWRPTHLSTEVTIAAVPAPNTSFTLPAFANSCNLGIVIFLSDTTKPDSGNPGTWMFPAT